MPASIVDAHAEALAYVAPNQRLSVLVRRQLLTRIEVIVALSQCLNRHGLHSLLLRLNRIKNGAGLVEARDLLAELWRLIICCSRW